MGRGSGGGGRGGGRGRGGGGGSPTPNINDPDSITREYAKANFEYIGEGVEGEVYIDPATGIAVKIQQIHTIKPEQLESMRLAAELGIGPQIYGVSKNGKILTMEGLRGFYDGIHPVNARTKAEIAEADRRFLALVKRTHDRGLQVVDLKDDNVMVNDRGQVRLIDVGRMPRTSARSRAEQVLDIYSGRPLVAERIANVINTTGSTAVKREFRNIQRRILNQDENPISDRDMVTMANRVYEMAGIK